MRHSAVFTSLVLRFTRHRELRGLRLSCIPKGKLGLLRSVLNERLSKSSSVGFEVFVFFVVNSRRGEIVRYLFSVIFVNFVSFVVEDSNRILASHTFSSSRLRCSADHSSIAGSLSETT